MSRQHILLGVLCGISVVSLVFALRERSEAKSMEYSRDQVIATLSAARSDVQKLSSRLDEVTTASRASAQAPVSLPPRPSPIGTRGRGTQSAGRRRNAEDPRWRRVESRLTDHQLQLAAQRERIAETQEDVRRTGDQLDHKISSTRDELNGSLTKTRDDVALLQKRGEVSIYEFDLAKSKEFQRVGPFSLSLRKADPKHRRYDLSLMVDDKPVEKERLSVSEPVWITVADSPQPAQLVVNQVEKDRIRGYISVPRYKNGELAGGPPADRKGSPLKQR